MPPTTVRQSRAPAHKVCVLAFLGMILIFGGGTTALFLIGMKWRNKSAENLRLLRAEQQRLKAPEYRPGKRDLNYRSGLEHLEKAQRFAWVLKSAAETRGTADIAAERFKDALKASPDFYDARLGLARAQALMFAYRDACDSYEAALEIENDPIARYEAAVLYTLRFLRRRAALTAGELSTDDDAAKFKTRAHEHAKAFIDSRIDGAKVNVVTGIDMMWNGRLDEAFDQFQQGAVLDPTQWAVPLFSAWVYFERADYVETAKRLQELTDRYPLLPEAHALRARTFEERALAESSISSWAEAVDIAPTFAEALLAMGRKLAGADARTALDSAVELDPGLKKYVEPKSPDE